MAGKLVAIVGPSGVGKTTIISILVDARRRFERMLFLTTRLKRFYEVNGRDYFFLTDEKLEALLSSDSTLQESLVIINGNRFAVSYSEIDYLVIGSERISLIELYIDRLPEFRKRYGSNLISLFLMPTSIEVLSQRLRDCRHHDDTFIVKRMTQARREIEVALNSMSGFFDDFITLSPNLEESVNQVERAISKLVLTRGAST